MGDGLSIIRSFLDNGFPYKGSHTCTDLSIQALAYLYSSLSFKSVHGCYGNLSSGNQTAIKCKLESC
ncbi:hypothetical protein XENTR_v10000157 [Xenopus tropicalis]|nr:hypothetical protein XENTR_v10000157 [Xenopus tropicalis]